MIADDEKHVCHGCIGEEYLATRVREEGTQVLCSYCGEVRWTPLAGQDWVRIKRESSCSCQ